MLAAITAPACLLPPDGQRPPPAPFPPEVDFTSLTPEEPLLRLRPDCGNFRIGVNRLTDLDSRLLSVRWVVNNNLPGTRLLDEVVLPPVDPGLVQQPFFRLDPGEDLDVDGDGTPDPSVLSLFVTDAPGWDIAGDSVPDPDTARNFGRAARPADGGVSGSTVEVRWAFVFSPAGECR